MDDVLVKLHGDGDEQRIRIRRIHQLCPHVALRFSVAIDPTPGEEPMPPVTVDIVNKILPPSVAAAAGDDAASSQSGGGGDAPPPAGEASKPATSFTCSSGDYMASSQSQLQKVQEIVAAAGLPPECAERVHGFCHLAAVSASNTFFASVAITVEADEPGNFPADEEEEDEEVPDGAEAGECSICYKEYVVGGATSVRLPCGHAYHRRCLDHWTRVNATCPYCRGPVPVPEDDFFWDDDD
ncbi:hypothetical protein PR202_ga01965 [Eleusine coracana subsp. coracana]|uniref:RING-type domain-containing protein n=1 Tax=Eleusine coracana subsp. coracana TaxID=191504 RepID=A0AAV5BIS3_ELECO|nr:hypothetical protein QOZ80_2AG0137240 [Eleusine coracana subsp. coracana]GJM85508.1 hypothetical protein PR202_ga01278 [Eleusine coracana subsp. coracana]GJM86136.1 hypothetical protein PR202_ga01965 [Eleusine coracana subsp. coracana]